MSSFYLRMAKRAMQYSPHFRQQLGYLIKKGRFRNALNYMWAMIFSREEGAGIADRFYAKHPLWAPYPERIELETTTYCNLRCPKCEHTYWKQKQKHMSYKQFIHIMKQFPRLKAISLSGIGHCFQNPDFFKMAEYLYKKGVYTQFFDPFLMINKEKSRKLIQLGINKIWISFDGATKKTYEKMQVGSNFERVKRNIRDMIKLKKALKSPFPEICFHYIVTKENYKEMPQFIDLVNELTKDDPTILKLVQFTRLIPFKENLWLRPPKIIPSKIIKETHKRASKNRLFRLDIFNINSSLPPLQCCVAWMVPFITVEGEAYPCCTLTEGNIRDKITGKAMGNVFKTHFKEIWNSDMFKQFKLDIKDNICPKLCYWPRKCTIYELKDSRLRKDFEGKEFLSKKKSF